MSFPYIKCEEHPDQKVFIKKVTIRSQCDRRGHPINKDVRTESAKKQTVVICPECDDLVYVGDEVPLRK